MYYCLIQQVEDSRAEIQKFQKASDEVTQQMSQQNHAAMQRMQEMQLELKNSQSQMHQLQYQV